jgi:hypothetical protein
MRFLPLFLAASAAFAAILVVLSPARDLDAHGTTTHYGDGSVQYSRMPWFTGQGLHLTQGWNSSFSHDDPYTYHGTDWGNDLAPSFAVYAAQEGSATCGLQGTWGNRVLIDHVSDTTYFRYAHLPTCNGFPTYLVQGDFINNAGETGCEQPCIHLHYQKETASQQTTTYALSNWQSFWDSSYNSHTFVSDSAGQVSGLTRTFGRRYSLST